MQGQLSKISSLLKQSLENKGVLKVSRWAIVQDMWERASFHVLCKYY